jgi:predicted nucleic acid-binding protein
LALLVLDASVIIDLERGGLLEVAFALEDVFITPDLLYERELKVEGGPYLQALGLQIVELDSDEVSAAQALADSQSGLSNADCWAAICAMRDDHRLLTGDGLLRSYATENKIPCSGVLWLLDRVYDAAVATPMVLKEGLLRASRHRRIRLPKHEVEKRLERWGK